MALMIVEIMEAVRKKRPLVLHITNSVSMNDCANATLCAGGSPVMSSVMDDAADLVKSCSAVVMNIGTADRNDIEAMIETGKRANLLGIPIVFDPVGVGATKYRADIVNELLSEFNVSVIKGNAGEIGFLAGTGAEVRGVDTAKDSPSNSAAVRELAIATGSIVAMSGPADYVSDGKKTYVLSNGHPYMDRVTGAGCMLSSVIGCYVGTLDANMDVVSSAISVFTIAGEVAAKKAQGPGSFRPLLFDELYNLDQKTIKTHLKTGEV